ncbi:PAS domain S-box protein [Coraliomargarita sp. SDUM461004]|uniref:histidine kinase n=1 Tax=Thalassobacterium sedimentorum TaxID=3041258 RepID=A0ABU1AM01_9BACT|nr:PAS domain S-box protein [Coraliomargarita sp. SDUM461004]MDQ8195830.1 PAS domain S-box protein [Coraliomargarita sp. SDUM461004]
MLIESQRYNRQQHQASTEALPYSQLNYQHQSKEALIQQLDRLKQAHKALQVSHEAAKHELASTQQVLNESQRKYHLLTHNSVEVVWALDNNYKLSYISPSIQQQRGINPREALNETIEASMPPHSQKLFLNSLIKHKTNAQTQTPPLQLELEQYHAEGRLIWVEMRIQLQRNQQGTIIGFVGNSRDITSRKKSEQAKMEIAKRYETLIAKVPVGIYVLGQGSQGQMEFKYVSDRWCEIHKISREEAMKGLSYVNKRIHEDDIEQFHLLNEEAIRHRKKFTWEGRMMSGNELRWFRIESTPISYKNNDHEWFGVAKDITLRKQAENALREREIQLRELNAQKDKFFSIIAHDLRSPFSGILGFSELLTTQINEGNYDDIHEYASIIEKLSKQSINLLTNLLEWAGAHTGRAQFEPQQLELKAEIETNKQLFDAIAGQKSISIHNDVPSGLMVYADKQMISTVLRNLISNALKFTEHGGKITLSAIQEGESVITSVHDNGVGIQANRLDKLFRIDEAESTPGTNKEYGTGLGLLLCKEFIEQHGGNIWAESELKSGSTFYFTLSTTSPAQLSRSTSPQEMLFYGE